MPSNFPGPSNAARQNVNKLGNFGKFSLGNLEKSVNFYERNPENSASDILDADRIIPVAFCLTDLLHLLLL